MPRMADTTRLSSRLSTRFWGEDPGNLVGRDPYGGNVREGAPAGHDCQRIAHGVLGALLSDGKCQGGLLRTCQLLIFYVRKNMSF